MNLMTVYEDEAAVETTIDQPVRCSRAMSKYFHSVFVIGNEYVSSIFFNGKFSASEMATGDWPSGIHHNF